jgi:uncharacterized membrane protein
MGPELSLFGIFTIATGFFLIRTGQYRLALSGRIAMSVMLLVIGTGHFIFTNGVAMMLPGFVPFKTALIYVTGIMELLAVVGLHLPRFRKITAWLLIVYFILILPANIYAASIHLNEQTGRLDGNGPGSLWYRIPLQIVFIAWVYFSSLRQKLQREGEITFSKQKYYKLTN